MKTSEKIFENKDGDNVFRVFYYPVTKTYRLENYYFGIMSSIYLTEDEVRNLVTVLGTKIVASNFGG